MKGLIYQYFWILAKDLRLILIYFIAYTAVEVMTDGNSSYLSINTSILFMYLAMVPSSLFEHDRKTKWDAYIQATPVSNTKFVGAKYILILLIIPVICILTILVNVLFGTIFDSFLVLLFAVAALGYCAIIMPLHYLIGANTGRIVTFITFCIPFVMLLIYTGKGAINLNVLTGYVKQTILFAAGATVFICTPLSFCISLAIQKRKEY